MKSLQLYRHANLLAGFFVASALIIFGMGTFVLLYKKGLFERTYELQACFDSGLGLRQGTDVQFNGVKIGRVQRVELVPVEAGPHRAGRVMLVLNIARKYQDFLTRFSVAYAERDKNLVSDRVINIETTRPGGQILQPGETLRVTDSRDIESVIGWMSRLTEKMDHLVDNIGKVVTASRDTNTSVGAMLGSRVMYDRILSDLSHLDQGITEGRHVLTRINRLGDTLYQHTGPLLARADTTSLRLQRTADEAERLGAKANAIADQSQVVLQRLDQVLIQGSGKLDQAGDVMDAISRLWFIRSKLEPPREFPALLNTADP